MTAVETDSAALLKSPEVAALLNVPVSTVQALTRRKELPTVPIGRTNRYRREAVLTWIEERER